MSLAEYIEAHSSPEGAVLEQITRNTHLEVINPRMLSGHVQGRVLSMLSKMIRPKRILELGTFTGYSALCLAEGLSEDGRLITIEHNDEMEDAIRRNLALSPLGEKIELVIGDAKEWLEKVKGETCLVTLCQFFASIALAVVVSLSGKGRRVEDAGVEAESVAPFPLDAVGCQQGLEFFASGGEELEVHFLAIGKDEQHVSVFVDVGIVLLPPLHEVAQ